MKILYAMVACVAVSTEENIGKIFSIFLELLGILGNIIAIYIIYMANMKIIEIQTSFNSRMKYV